MIDFHSHVLPGIDDGSRSVRESLELLAMEKAQGIRLVAATPHFYPEEQSLEQFLLSRDESARQLKETLSEDAPSILVGAEVLFYEGMAHTDGLSRLCLERTRLLLLEMPWERWSHRTLDAVISLPLLTGLTVVIAHAERYLPLQKRDVREKLLESSLLLQCNASFFIDRKTSRQACRMLAEGKIRFIGSDCHRVAARPPRLAEAFAVIAERNGPDAPKALWQQMAEEIRRNEV